VVPKFIKGNCTDFVLERNPKKIVKWPHWGPVAPQASMQRWQPEHLHLEQDTIQSKIQKAYKCYGRLKEDKGRHNTWLASLIDTQATALQVSKKSIWACIRRMEQMCNNTRMIKKALLVQDHHQGLTHVVGPHPANITICIKSSSKAELEQLCLEEVGWHFTQAANTLFLQPPLLALFLEANVFTKSFNQVLAGTFAYPPGTDPMAIHLIMVLKCPEHLPTIPN